MGHETDPHDGRPTRVTVVVAPRERFDLSLESLGTIIEHTHMPFELVYIDGRSPRRIRLGLEEAAREHGFTLVRRNNFLAPNEARAIGLAEVRTPYVVFVDNDLLVTEGWLERLVECADETGAWAVGPLYFEGDPHDEIIHMAGGDLELTGTAPHRAFRTDHRLQGIPLAEVPTLQRERCGFVEFHCMLLRTSAFEHVTLDQRLLSTREHLDLCLQITEAGGEVWFEPASRVTYATPPPVALTDVPYFWLRWSESWNEGSLRHFCDKHGIDSSYADRAEMMRARRHVVFDPVRQLTQRALGERADRIVTRGLTGVEHRVNRRLVRPRVGSS